jgi:hypothetical protein
MLDYQLEVLAKLGAGIKARKYTGMLLKIARNVPESTIMAALASTQDARLESLNPERSRLGCAFSYYIACLKAKGVEI